MKININLYKISRSRLGICLVLIFSGISLIAESIVCEGVVGNSGEQGKDLIRFGKLESRPHWKDYRGMGIAYDRFGCLWDRAGKGILNRYALDGRLIGQYGIPAVCQYSDKLALVGDKLLLLIRNQLYILDIKLSSGAKAKDTGIVNIEGISFNNLKGRILCLKKDGVVFWLDPVTLKQENIVTVPKDLILYAYPVIGSDGTLYVARHDRIFKIENGKLLRGADFKKDNHGLIYKAVSAKNGIDWPKQVPGERVAQIGDYWYGNTWHGTIKRFDKNFNPAPGVILGGASGSFIGHLDQNSELMNGRGILRIKNNLFAVSGLYGIAHLMVWKPEKKKMEIIRRIGALPAVNGIGLDRKGHIWVSGGGWNWNDSPVTPQRRGGDPGDWPGCGQVVMLENDKMIAPIFLYGKPGFAFGSLGKEISVCRLDKNKCKLSKGFVGSAVYREKPGGRGAKLLLVINSKGAGRIFSFNDNGAIRYLNIKDKGNVKFNLKKPVNEWTSLAMKDADTLLGGGDGYIIEMVRDGKDWREVKRWNSTGGTTADTFGDKIYITADSGRLWVSDTEKHRVLCLNSVNGKKIAEFGTSGKPGNSMKSLDSPRIIIARGDKAVVYDSENQRLMKLKLEN